MNRSVLVDASTLARAHFLINVQRMARPKEEDRPRSIRIPCTEKQFKLAHKLAGDQPVAVWLRDLIEREAIAAKLVKPRTKARKTR